MRPSPQKLYANYYKSGAIRTEISLRKLIKIFCGAGIQYKNKSLSCPETTDCTWSIQCIVFFYDKLRLNNRILHRLHAEISLAELFRNANLSSNVIAQIIFFIAKFIFSFILGFSFILKRFSKVKKLLIIKRFSVLSNCTQIKEWVTT